MPEAYDVLSALDFIDEDYTIESIVGAGEVTRGEFADAMYRVFGDGITSDELYFHDVPASHYAANAVSVLVTKKAISIGEDRMFYPENIISRTEAAKMICYVLGYDMMCTASGGWTEGIEKTASKLALYDGTSRAERVKYSDMIIMLYNAMLANIFDADGVKGDSLIYEASNDTYLSKNYDIYVNDGVLTAYDGVSIYGDIIENGEVIIGDLLLDANGIDAKDLLGLKVKYFYHYDETTDSNTLLWVKDLGKTDYIDLNKFDNEMTFDASNYTMSYYEGNRRKTAQLERSINVIYNDGYVLTNVEAVLNRAYYGIRLIESDDGNYGFAIITDYENYTLSTVDSSGESIYVRSCSDTTSYEFIELDDYERTVVATADGTEIGFADILPGDVLSIMKTVDYERITIVTSSKTVSGRLNSSTSEDGYRVFSVDEQPYTAYKAGVTFTGISTGTDVTLKFDAYGYVAEVSDSLGSVRFGYLVKTFYDDSEEILSLKIFDQSGEMEKYNAAKSVYLDGIRYKEDFVGLDGALGGRSLSPTLIAYELNSDDEVKMIDIAENAATAIKTERNMLTLEETVPAGRQYKGTGKFDTKIRLNNSTLVFRADASMDESKFSVNKASVIPTYKNLPEVKAYSYGLENKEFIDVLVMNLNWEVPNGDGAMLVDKIKLSINDDDEPVYIVEGYDSYANKISQVFSNEAASVIELLDRGDFYVASGKYGSEYTGLTKLLDASNINGYLDQNGNIATNTYSVSGDPYTGYRCFVNDIIGTTLRVSNTDGSSFDELFILNTDRIFVYDTATNTLEKGSVGDLRPYDVAGSGCSFIFHAEYNDRKLTIAYK